MLCCTVTVKLYQCDLMYSCLLSLFSLHTDQLQIFKGSTLGRCHTVEAFLGEGGFGFVTKCRNTETGRTEAVKVNKTHPEVVCQAKLEIAVLKRLRCLDPDTCNIVRWNGFFFDQEHICLNFELLDQSLRDYMADRNHQGLSIRELSPVVHQLATALSHLRSIGIVHADLKPDNVMVVDRKQQPIKVKLIDFGLARPVSAAKAGACVQTTWYRAPEIMLHIPFNEAIDMWSLGLVAVELATGCPLYPGETDYDMLNFIMETQGQLADYLLDRGVGTDYYFHKQQNSQQLWRFKTPEEFAYETGFYAEETRYIRLRSLDDLEQILAMERGHQSDQRLFVDLVKRMLQLDGDLRIKPLEVLRHPLFDHSPPQCSRPDICITLDPEETEPEVSRQPPSHQTPGPGGILRQRRAPTLTAVSEHERATLEENDLKEADVQPEDNAKQDGWFRRLFKRITGAFHLLLFYCDG